MDDFNNFFDHDEPQPERTPIYHTPNQPRRSSKVNVALIVSVIIAVIMTLVVIVNVVLLATLKDNIAKEYADSIARDAYDQYTNAVQDVLNNSDIVEDVKNSATQGVLNSLQTTVGEIACEKAASVARLYMYTYSTDSANRSAAMATAFLITNSDDAHPQRYLVTNAHCVRYVAKNSLGGIFGNRVEYRWTSYGKIIAVFDNDAEAYPLEIVAYGSYSDDNAEPENEQPDLAILKVSGNQPSNEEHPALKLASSDYTSPGSPIALIGNPEGIGSTNSISTGCVSQTGIKIESWGAGTFILTDAALNSGNSGGPMIDKLGNVVGVAESKLIEESIDNMGFALSASTLCDFLKWASISENNILDQTLDINCVYVTALE